MSSSSSSSSKDWGVAGVWNSSLKNMEIRAVQERDHLWASELGKAPVDVFYHLAGTTPSNPPNYRSMRKFEAGNVFEWIVKLMFKRAGIMIDEEVHCKHQYSGLLEVTGRLDVLAGGKPDFSTAIAELKALDMPQVFIRAAEEMKFYFDTHYSGQILSPKPIEIKSLSSFMFEALLARKSAVQAHRMQLTHYLKALGFESGSILYICRDDLRMMEVPVMLEGKAEQEYKEAIELHSGYQKTKTLPPLEEPVVYDLDTGKFSANWKVGYSMYLTKLYGLADQAEFDEKYRSAPTKWNSTLKRFREGSKMTPLNLARMKEMSDAGFDVAKIAMS